jgi:hypothetical protein
MNYEQFLQQMEEKAWGWEDEPVSENELTEEERTDYVVDSEED